MSPENASWDAVYDVVVVGSGAAGLTAAITAADAGLRTLLVEKEATWGGTTGYSGGGLWIPDNHLMRQAGGEDSVEEALEYLAATVPERTGPSSPARQEAYLRRAPELALFLEQRGVEWVHSTLYPDYYPSAPGAKTGRCIEPQVFDAKRLGPWRETLIPVPRPPLALTSDDVIALQLVKRTPSALGATAKILGRTAGWFARGRVPLAAGQALVAQLMYALQSRYEASVWLDSPLRDLVTEDGRVIGAVIEREGRTLRVRADRGVLLGAGGFARDAEYRGQYQSVGSDWTSAAPGDTGDAIKVGERLGAELARMDQAWWGVSFRLGGEMFLSVWERSLPGCLIVDESGRRFGNESTSYVDLGRAILEKEREPGQAPPTWLIMDARHRKRYLFGPLPPGMTPRRMIDDGTFVKSDSLEDLARQCQIDPRGLAQTVRRFNGFARSGIDADFRRGDDIYDRYYSDPTAKPNPTLGPVERSPFWATRVYPGDASTNGGLVTDDFGRVLRADGSIIQGLYAAGNTTAAVMGSTYPGPGATIGPAATFAYISMRHAAEQRATR